MTVIWKHAFILFGIVFLFDAVIGNALYMNPPVAGVYSRMAGHPGIKPWQEFGTMGNFILLNTGAGVILAAFYVTLFSLLRSNLPESVGLAGLVFGILLILLKAAPEAWNQYLIINYPVNLVLIQFANSSISITISGIVLALAWTRFPVLR